MVPIVLDLIHISVTCRSVGRTRGAASSKAGKTTFFRAGHLRLDIPFILHKE